MCNTELTDQNSCNMADKHIVIAQVNHVLFTLIATRTIHTENIPNGVAFMMSLQHMTLYIRLGSLPHLKFLRRQRISLFLLKVAVSAQLCVHIC